ncbi:hypothetical protein BG58_41105 [Caballeronia jiangsuensis]|nr:hypothetical protein BG58_41105 [Caballeronia jiangsuensis]
MGLGKRGQVGDAAFGQSGERIYVNAANGNLLIQDRDQMLLGLGGNSSVYRAYNSLGQASGDHWKPGGARTVNQLTGTLSAMGSTVTLTDWDGSSTLYAYDVVRKVYVSTTSFADVGPSPDAGPAMVVTAARDTLSFDPASQSWIWKDGAHGQTQRFDAAYDGRLMSVVDRDDNAASYAYNAKGLLSEVTTSNGDITHLDYNAAGQLVTLRAEYCQANGQRETATTTRYTYDAQGRLSEVFVDLSPLDSNIADGNAFKTTYTYDDTSSRIASIAQSDGSRIAFTYVLVGGDYRVATMAQTADDGVTRVSSFSYDTANRKTAITDPLGFKQVLTYDAAGRLTNIATSGAGDTSSRSFNYDANGNLHEIHDPLLGSVYFSYDDAGNLLRQTGGGCDLTRTYGASNEVLTERVSGSSPTTAVGNQTTRYAYDSRGHLRFGVSGEGRVTEYRYNEQGQRIAEIRYAGSVFNVSDLGADTSISTAALDAWVTNLTDRSNAVRIDTTWDYRNQIASETRYERLLPDGTADLSAGIVQTRYVYDAFGRLLQHFVGAPGQEKVEQFAYDGLGRLLAATSFDGVVTLYQYDDAHRAVAVTFSSGLTRTSTFNAAGELISVADTVQGRLLSRTSNAYDADGRLRMSTDADGRMTHYLYNGRGQKVAEISSDGTLAEYGYDSQTGYQNTTTTYATRLNGAQTSALVDGAGKPIERLPSGVALTLENSGLRPKATAVDRKQWLVHNESGWVIGTIDSDGTAVKYTYDTRGNVIRKATFANRVDVAELSGASLQSDSFPQIDGTRDRVTNYYYDRDGLLQGEVDAEGSVTEYRYNGAGKRTETVRYAKAIDVQTRDGVDFRTLIPVGSAQDMSERFVYDSRGLLAAQVDAEGYVTRYRYDDRGNVIERVRGARIDPGMLSRPQLVPVTFMATGKTGATFDIWIDGVKAVGLSLSSPSGSYTVMANNAIPLASHTIEFRSVKTNPVTFGAMSFGERAFTPIVTNTVTFDGNPPQIGVRFAADAASLLSSLATDTQTERTIYAYDSVGRVVERATYDVTGRRTDRYTYDKQGRLTSETTGDRTQTYRYDAQGRLTGQLTGEGSAALSALGVNPSQAQVDDVWNKWGVCYAYDAAGVRTSMTDANGRVTRYYYDDAGRLGAVVNALGGVTHYAYDAFGDVMQSTVYSTRLDAGVLSNLTGGKLTDSLSQIFTALGADGQASRTSFSYSSMGRLSSRDDAMGARTDYSYDAFGEIASKTEDVGAGVRTATTFAYDRTGRLVQQVSDANGLKVMTRAIHDAFGRVVQTIDANGASRRTDYDRNGNVVVVTDAMASTTTMTYDAFGHLLTLTDRTDNTTKYAYSATDRQLSMTTPEGLRTVTTYNESGQIIRITDGRGNSTSYTYDLDGNLIQTESPAATTKQAFDHTGHLIETTDARGVKTAFSYDAVGRMLTRTVDPCGLALVTRYEYDAKGALVCTTDPSGMVTQTQYDLDGRAVSVTADAAKSKLRTEFAYDSAGRVVTVTEGAGTASSRVTQKIYDNLGRLVSSTVDPAGLKLTTTYAYDANGNVVGVTDAAGGVTRYAYDAQGRQIWSVGPTGAAVESMYDKEGRLTLQKRFATPVSLSGLSPAPSDVEIAASVSEWSQRDEVNRYAYDSDGRLRFTIDALGYVTEQICDANGSVISRTAYATAIALSSAPDVKAISNALQAQSGAMHAGDRTVRLVYDTANRLVFVIDASGFVTRNRYDEAGNRVEQTSFTTRYTTAGSRTQAELETWAVAAQSTSTDQTTTTFFDAVGRPVYVVDAEGYVTEKRYDAAGRILKFIRYAESYANARSATNATLKNLLPVDIPNSASVVETRYDQAGRITDVIDGLNNVTHFELDSLGHAIVTWIAYQNTQARTAVHRSYDAAGRMLDETRAYNTSSASITRYEYDAMGRLTRVVDPRAEALTTSNADWAISQRKLLGVIDSTKQGKLASGLTDADKEFLRQSYSMSYEYDAQGNQIRVIDALGHVTSTSYDAFGNAVRLTDPLGNSTLFFFDQLNRCTVVVNALNYVVRTEFSPSGKPIKVTQYANAYAGATSINMDASAINPVAAPARDAVTRLEYDALDRLVVSVDAENNTERWAYDGLGNKTSHTNKIGGLTSYTYDRRGLVLSESLPITSSEKMVVNRYEYDARGNRVKMTEAAGLAEQRITQYQFDLLDRRVKVVPEAIQTYSSSSGSWTSNSPTDQYTYDVRGNLTSHTNASGKTEYWYYDAAGRKIAEVNVLGTMTRWDFDAAGNVMTQKNVR